MKPAGWRTTLTWRARTWWRWLLLARYALEESIERWWERHICAPDPRDRAFVEAMAVAYTGPDRAWYPGGARADVWVPELGKGWEGEMVAAYLRQLERPAPREVIG